MRVSVSGKTYMFTCDPTNTDFLADHPEIPEPTPRRVGRGTSWDFGELDGDQLFTLLWRLETIWTAFLDGGMAEGSREDGHAIRKDWRRLMLTAEPHEKGYYIDYNGKGWFKNGEDWICVRGADGQPTPVGYWNRPRTWLEIGRNGPFRFVKATRPDNTWLKVD